MGNPANAPITPAAGLKRRAEEIEDQLPRLYTNPIKLTAIDVDELIKMELNAHVYQDQSELLDTLFPVLGDASKNILRRLSDLGLWRDGPGKSGEWVHLSKEPPDELSLYQPWADIANKVAELDRPRDDGLIMAWRITYDKPPISYWPTTYLIKPDLIAQLEDVRDQPRSFDERAREPHAWCRAVIPAEFKKENVHIPTVVQLIHYVRQSFREQPDRRFIIGIAFARRLLTVWYFDRSGVLGSVPFDVHSYPERFIQVLLGLARMSPTDLGFDPTFQLYQDTKSEPECIPSYLISNSIISQGFDSLPWVFSMPNKDGPGREEFITIRAISVNRAEVVRGRGTRIWVACRLADYQDTRAMPVHLFVFKAMWKDIRRLAEGEIYKDQGPTDGIAKLYSYEDVRIDGEDDNTILGKHGLGAEGMAAELRKKTINTSASQNYFDEFFNRTPGLPQSSRAAIIPWLDPLEVRQDKVSVRPRVHCRLLLETFGTPLTYFGSLSELMQAFIDAVEGHRRLSNKGYLHRDISRGNIMITPSESPNRGVLIDQDYAVPDWDNPKGTDDDHRTGTLAFMAAEMIDDNPVVKHPKKPLTTEEASVTVFSMDHKLKFVPPRPIHDLESFFWVLCWICVSREGPATTRQESETDTKGKDAINAANILFGQTDLAQAANFKRELLTEPGLFETHVMHHAAPCFGPILQAVRVLRNALYAAYYDEAKEKEKGIYGAFLDGLRIGLESANAAERDGTLSKVKDYDTMCRKAMEKRRSNQITETPVRYAIPPGQGHIPPPEPESPTPPQRRKKPRHDNTGDVEEGPEIR